MKVTVKVEPVERITLKGSDLMHPTVFFARVDSPSARRGLYATCRSGCNMHLFDIDAQAIWYMQNSLLYDVEYVNAEVIVTPKG